MFDEEPDGDIHGECAAEIHRLQAENAALRAENAQLRAWVAEAEKQEPVGVIEDVGVYPRIDGLYHHHFGCAERLSQGAELYTRPIPPANPVLLTDEQKRKLWSQCIKTDSDDWPSFVLNVIEQAVLKANGLVGLIKRRVIRQNGLQMNYETNPRNVLPNGLTLLQVNPDCAARLDPQARDHGWLYVKGADCQWVTHRKLSDDEIEEAYDQAADMSVKNGKNVRAG